jgi:hypothetical protein
MKSRTTQKRTKRLPTILKLFSAISGENGTQTRKIGTVLASQGFSLLWVYPLLYQILVVFGI